MRVRACAVRVSVAFRATLCLLPFSLREKRFKGCLGAATRNLSFGHKNRLKRVSRGQTQKSVVKGCYWRVFGKGYALFYKCVQQGVRVLFFAPVPSKGYFLKAGVCCMLYVLEKARVFLLFASLLRGTLLDPLCDSTSGTRCRPPKQKAPIRFSPPLAGRGFSVLFFHVFLQFFPKSVFFVIWELPRFCRSRQYLVFSCECLVLYPIPLLFP